MMNDNILETLRMIEEEKLDIRTVTMGISAPSAPEATWLVPGTRSKPPSFSSLSAVSRS